MRLVKEGKVSPEDAADLVEAFVESEETSTAIGDEKTDPLTKLVTNIEKAGREITKGINWQEISSQIKIGIDKGSEAIKKASEDARKSGGLGFLFGQSATRHIELPFEIKKSQVFRIDGGSGDVKVFGGAKEAQLVIDASHRAMDQAEAQRISEAYTPVLEESDKVVAFRRPDGPNVRVDVELHLPRGVAIEVDISNGDLDVKGTNAACRVSTHSGDVMVNGAKGSIEVMTASGDVSVGHCKSSFLIVDSRSGDVSLESIEGTANVKSSSGTVTVTDSKCQTLAVELANGDMDVELCEPVNGTVSLRTVNGNVSVSVLDGSDCRVSLSTINGSVATQVELQDCVEEGLLITGKLGEGTGTIDASAVRGNVLLQLTDCSAD